MPWLQERLTFDKLFRISDPKRVYRSFTVRGPPLEIDSYQDSVYYIFNFKANPSTTGLRHRGYVKFFKPKHKNAKDVPLQHLDCLVDCECPDFRYRWAWANKQRQSSVVGPSSLNQALNRAPRKTNPRSVPGLCKHLLAARQYIYGLLSSFSGDEPDTAEKLNRLTKHATKRWTDFEGQMRAAKAKEAELRRRRELRNAGQLPATTVPSEPAEPATAPLDVPEPPELGGPTPAAVAPVTPRSMRPPPPAPYTATPTGPRKRVLGNRTVVPPEPGAYGWVRPEQASLLTMPVSLLMETVVSANSEPMKSIIKEAIALVEEMEAEELELAGAGDAAGEPGGGLDFGSDMSTLEPSEPPVSDSAIGADTEGDSALSLLRSIKTSLEQISASNDQIAGAVAPEAGEPGEPGEADMPALPPEDFTGSGDDASGESSGSDDEDDTDDDDDDDDDEAAKGGKTRPSKSDEDDSSTLA